MPAIKTFSRYAEKLATVESLLAEGKTKQALTVIRKLKESASKRAGVAGEKKKRAPSAWQLFVKDFMKAHPELSATEAMKAAAKEYKSGVSKKSPAKKSTKEAATKKSATKKSATKKTSKKAATKKSPAKKKSTKKSPSVGGWF